MSYLNQIALLEFFKCLNVWAATPKLDVPFLNLMALFGLNSGISILNVLVATPELSVPSLSHMVC